MGVASVLKNLNGLKRLSTRERWLVIIVTCLFSFILVFELAVSPLLEARKKMSSSLENSTKQLELVKELKHEYISLKKAEGGIQERLAKREPKFALFSFLDSEATKAGVKQNIQSMKPSSQETESDGLQEEKVEMKLTSLHLEELVHFLQLVESDVNVVFIRRLSIQANVEKGSLDVLMSIVTFTDKKPN